ncbi:MAG: hypothetical protein ACI8RD_001739, partial [Bacillariaceae sp.]|jgi:hypothetical protein
VTHNKKEEAKVKDYFFSSTRTTKERSSRNSLSVAGLHSPETATRANATIAD